MLDSIHEALEQAADEHLDAPSRLRWLGTAATQADRIYIHDSAIHSDESAETRVDETGIDETGIDSMHQRCDISPLPGLLDRARRVLAEAVLPAVAETGIQLSTLEELDPHQREWLSSAFEAQIFPLLIPLAVDPGRPFPRLREGRLNLLVMLEDQTGEAVFAVIEDPNGIGRWLKVETPKQGKKHKIAWYSQTEYAQGTYLWAEDVIRSHLQPLFPGMEIKADYLFRVLYTESSGSQASQKVARLDIEASMPERVRLWLNRHLGMPAHTLVLTEGPMGMADLVKIAGRMPTRRRGLIGWLHRVLRVIFRRA